MQRCPPRFGLPREPMPRTARRFVLLAALALLLASAPAWATRFFPVAASRSPEDDGWQSFLDGWRAFGDVTTLHMLSIVLMSLLLSASIAWHPRCYGRASTLEEVEQPKTFLLYALVGSVVGRICGVSETMALVIFGLGGLFRFRSDAGSPKDAGRLILVTLVGISCGLDQFVPAVVATAVAWMVIWMMEAQGAHRLVVKGLGPDLLPRAAAAYHEQLKRAGAKVMSENKNFGKGQVAFVLLVPGAMPRSDLEDRLRQVPQDLQGAVDWESG